MCIRDSWITVAALVVVVVIGFLIGIVSSLSSIDEGLFEADSAVTGIRGDARPLPDYVQEINSNLTKIDKSLKPITGQADDILGALGSIRGRLGSVDASLVDTDASLSDTSASLVDTSGQLGNITSLLVDTSGQLGNISTSLIDTSDKLGRISPSLVDTKGRLVRITTLAGRIDRTLVAAQSVNSLGTNAIWRRVRFLNGGPFRRPGDRNDNDNDLAGPATNPNGLLPIKSDAGNILGGLRKVNRHLTSICQAPVLSGGAGTAVGLTGLIDPNGPC